MAGVTRLSVGLQVEIYMYIHVHVYGLNGACVL